MRTRVLAGRTVAAVGLGDTSFVRAAARNHDPAEVVRRIHEALELAIDVIDLAPEPDVERAAGEAVRAVRARDRAVLVTHVRLPDVRDIAGLVAQVDASLRATRLDALPLVELPLRAAWLEARAWPEFAFACERLARDGKVMAWGLRVEAADAAVPAADAEPSGDADEDEPRRRGTAAADPLAALTAGFASTGSGLFVPTAGFAPTSSGLFVPSLDAPPPAPTAPEPQRAHPLALPMVAALAIDFSLCDRTAAPVLAAASSHAILARRPLAGGALAGTLGPGAVLARTDDRRGADLDAIALAVAELARFVKRPPPAAGSTEAARALAETARRPDHVECETLAELALRYALDRGALVLPRIVRAADLHEAVAAAAARPLSADLMSALDT